MRPWLGPLISAAKTAQESTRSERAPGESTKLLGTAADPPLKPNPATNATKAGWAAPLHCTRKSTALRGGRQRAHRGHGFGF